MQIATALPTIKQQCLFVQHEAYLIQTIRKAKIMSYDQDEKKQGKPSRDWKNQRENKRNQG